MRQQTDSGAFRLRTDLFSPKLFCFGILAGLLIVLLAFPEIVSLLAPESRKAFADGLTQENLPPASIGDRQASLFVQVNPPVLTSETIQNAFMQFRLFDANNNQTIEYVTYRISVTKGMDDSAKPLMSDFFHSESGLLKLKIQPSDSSLVIYGTREPFLTAWVADPGGTVNVKGPLLLEGGIYHFQIDIFGIDSIRNIFKPEDAPRFDSWLSVGDKLDKSFSYGGQEYNTTIISYYDKVADFEFDEEKQTFTWSMPFDWDVSRIGSTSIFVHQEMRIPKALEGIGDAQLFAGAVNGDALSGSRILLDPYASETELIVHYLLSKADILQMAANQRNGTTSMDFTLSPASASTAQTTAEMVSDTGGVNVRTRWTPDPLDADAPSTVTLEFSDGFSGQKITSDVTYDLVILDQKGNEVFRESAVAKGGTDSKTVDFPENDNYRTEVTVKGLSQDGRPADLTRNGIARGVVVVPEFSSAMVVVAVSLAAAIAARLRHPL